MSDEPSKRDPQPQDSFDALLRAAARISDAPEPSGPLLPVGGLLLGGRLSILRQLGQGGMGVVYEAFDAERGQRVACKTMHRLDATGIYRLKNEFRALANLTHPNLVRLHELFADSEAWFFTMELVEGERFDRWVRPHGALDTLRLRQALPQLVAGAEAIHAAGKLHRDLKPSNVLVTGEGRVVVLDFGLAVAQETGSAGQTLGERAVQGTPAYMAPEQAEGSAVGAHADYYAIGVMLFEALTGQLPFDGGSGRLLAAKQIATAPHARALEPQAPADLADLAAALLERAPERRAAGGRVQAWLREHAGTTPAEGTEPRAQPGHASSAPAAARDTSPPGPPTVALRGRDDELGKLRAAYRAARAGAPVVLFVSGESGMGKSALVEAFGSELRAQGEAVVLAGRCYERENVPFKAFDALVDALSRHLRKLPAHDSAALLPREVFALARIFPALDRVPTIASAPRKDIPDPQDLKRRAFEAFGELLGRMRDRTPVVLLIDDLQWVDQDSVRFMRALLVHPQPVPVLLVCTHRSEGQADNARLTSVISAARDNAALDVRTLEVGPLPIDALSALVQELAPELDPGAIRALASEAHGSPFFATELSRATRAGAGRGGALSLEDALGLHVAALPTECQRLLSLLALAGQPLAQAHVIAALGLSDGHAHLDRLRAEQLVRVSFDRDAARTLECYHDRIREQVAGRLDALSVRELALSLSRALLTSAEPDAELLARLLTQAGLPEQAAEHAVRAAERAFGLLAFDRAAGLFAQAIEQGHFEAERARSLRVRRAESLAHAGLGERAGEAFHEAAMHAPADQAEELKRLAGEQFLLCGDLERGRKLLSEVLRGAGIGFPESLPAALASVVGRRSWLRLRGSTPGAPKPLDAATTRELTLLRGAAHGLLRSDMLRGADFAARWVLAARAAGDRRELGHALAWEILFASMFGQSDEALLELYARCEQLARETSDWRTEYSYLYTFGIYLTVRATRPAEATPKFDRALALLNDNPSPTTSYDRAWVEGFRQLSLLGIVPMSETAERTHALLEDAFARGDLTVTFMLGTILTFAMLAVDRPELCEQLLARIGAELRDGETTLQHTYWVPTHPMPALYRGDARASWYAALPSYDHYLTSFLGRYAMRGMAEGRLCLHAAAAARQASTAEERTALERRARSLALVTMRAPQAAGQNGVAEALLASLRHDRVATIDALRRATTSGYPPFYAHVIDRRRGELMQGAEGARLVEQADAAMRQIGVVDPARFTAAMLPGLELPA